MLNLLYNKNSLIGILKNYFYLYFESFPVGTAENLFMFVLSVIALESANSIRFLYTHFLKGISRKSLNAFYYTCSYAKLDYSKFMGITAKIAISLISDFYAGEPVFLLIDDTIVPKFGCKFESVSKLFDHSYHKGSKFLNGHCFVSLTICIPVSRNGKIHYMSIPLGYKMRQKEKSKMALAADMVSQIMPVLSNINQVILLFDSWYAKNDMTSLVSKYSNLDIICSTRCDSVLYDLPPERTGKRGRPAKHGKRLSIYDDFTLSDDKIGNYFIGYRKVISNIFSDLTIMAYVTASNKTGSGRRLFLSTINPADIHISCAWQEKSPLNQTGKDWMCYIPLFLYSFRWNIEVGYYEQKTFWSLCNYMVRSKRAIELVVNLINIAYCSMKILPYKDSFFNAHRNESVQEFRFCLSKSIKEQIFITGFVNFVESSNNSKDILELLKERIFSKSA